MEAIAHVEKFLTEQQSKSELLFHFSSDTVNHKTSITIQSRDGALSGQISIQKALESDVFSKKLLSEKQLKNVALISAPHTAHAELIPMLCYFALRQARIWGCEHVIAADRMPEFLQLQPLPAHPSISAEQIKHSIFHAFNFCDAAQQQFIQTFFVREIVATFQHWLSHFFTESWFRAVHSESISKKQYIATLFHAHQFVRHTTRLAARCVTLCDNRELRNHYLNHLKGEINHELIIESDLKALGVDVEYLLTEDVPNAVSSEFMVVQESVTAYRQDPIAMLACPFAAEGMTANISHDFVDHLYVAIRKWGIEKPESVARFLTSHMKTDGGDDGHWMYVIMRLDQFIRTEKQLQVFLATFHLATRGYARGLNACIDDFALWSD